MRQPAFAFKHAQRRDGIGHDRGLGIFGQRQLILRPLAHDRATASGRAHRRLPRTPRARRRWPRPARLPMPTFWLPCPGNTNARMAFSSHAAQRGSYSRRLWRLSPAASPKGTILLAISCPISARPRKAMPATLAPIARDLFGIGAERTVIFGHIAHPPEPQPGDAAKLLRNVEEQPVDRIEMLRHFLHHAPHGRQDRASARSRTASPGSSD